MTDDATGRRAGPRTEPLRTRKLIVPPSELQADLEARERDDLSGGREQRDLYPERHMPIAGAEPRAEMWTADDADTPPAGPKLQAARDRHELFSAARERLLIDYRYNTARAYWGDLDDIYFWCEHRGFDIFELTDREFRQYQGLLRRRKYSPNTVRRRAVAYRLFRRVVDAE